MATTRREFLQATGAGVTLAALGERTDAAPAAGSASDLCFASAVQLARMIRAREVSAREVMAAHLRQIERVNPRVNAIVAKLDDARCMALAEEADRRVEHGEALGPLHGLPFAFKDLEPVVGFPFTRGSPIFAHEQPK